MKVYLHIGTEKTGSSHLQSIAAINREHLAEEGVWFPEAEKLEHQMLKGEISAGNAQNITDALDADDFETCSEILTRHFAEAKENGCHSLFLSNELLVLALAKENRMNLFEALLERVGCPESEYLLFLRDPVEQALSLYKHRAKSGTAPNIENWPEKHYLYGTGLLSFIKKTENQEIDLTCRKFSKKKGALEEKMFKEWLGLDVELTPTSKMVNPSLSLSELLLIKKVRDYQPELANILYERLLAVNKDLKAEQTSMDQYHRDVLSNYIARYADTWRACNTHLPETENLVYPSKIDEYELNSGKLSSFSEVQMNEISAIIADSISFHFKLKIEWLKWRKRLGRLKSRLFS